jgi:hypothetical protein
MRFKYYVCQRDIICIAHGDMHRVKFYVKKHNQCPDEHCDIKTMVEVIVSIINPNKSETTKSSVDKKRTVRSRLPKGNRRTK